MLHDLDAERYGVKERQRLFCIKEALCNTRAVDDWKQKSRLQWLKAYLLSDVDSDEISFNICIQILSCSVSV